MEREGERVGGWGGDWWRGRVGGREGEREGEGGVMTSGSEEGEAIVYRITVSVHCLGEENGWMDG